MTLVLFAAALLASADPSPASGYQPIVLRADWTSKVQLVSVTHEQWLQELQALRGRIVVVDAWATWCLPCIERFPRMIQMARKWSSPRIAFVTLSLDDRDDPQALRNVRKFLTEQNARLPNFLMNEVNPDAFEKLGLLGVPAVFIYDRDGRLAHRLTGDDPNHQFTDADIEAAVRAMAGRSARQK